MSVGKASIKRAVGDSAKVEEKVAVEKAEVAKAPAAKKAPAKKAPAKKPAAPKAAAPKAEAPAKPAPAKKPAVSTRTVFPSCRRSAAKLSRVSASSALPSAR